ncbi:hypothetical protein E4U52_004539 [Claviceps spartinae]|nr:hypothetical protein E4U52_004539 [Claviceps spartinae]
MAKCSMRVGVGHGSRTWRKKQIRKCLRSQLMRNTAMRGRRAVVGRRLVWTMRRGFGDGRVGWWWSGLG